MAVTATCRPVRISTVDDANLLFHAVMLDRLPLFTRRLTIQERRNIHTGCVFVWEERVQTQDASGEGIERWTDGRRWSCSRVKNDFLFYQEKLPELGDINVTAAMEQNRLVKQTYSVYVQTPQGRRKWHLVAYYIKDKEDVLLSVNEIPELAELRSAVPRGAYRPARITRGRPRPDNPHYDPAPEDSYGDFPAIRPYGDDSTLSSTSPQPSSTDSDTSSPSRGDISLEYFPDPTWVLQHGRRVDCFESNEAKFFPSRGCKTLAPLEYKRLSPYPVRHPLDNVALRLFDAAPWMTAHW